MSAPHDLREVYIDEMKDLWSANNQMAATLRRIVPSATDDKLKTMLEHSIGASRLTAGC